MSDDERDLEMETAERRAHHNALERRRRDHIKDSFNSLRESVPTISGEKVASRAQVLKRTADYILYMQRRNESNLRRIRDLETQNAAIENQIRILEKTKETGNFAMKSSQMYTSDSLSEDEEEDCTPRKTKKMKKTK